MQWLRALCSAAPATPDPATPDPAAAPATPPAAAAPCVLLRAKEYTKVVRVTARVGLGLVLASPNPIRRPPRPAR